MALVLFEKRTPTVGLITLNDPDSLNAMGEEMAEEFSHLISRLKNEKLRALFLTGAGRAFSAGGRLEMLERKCAIAPEENRALMMKFYRSFLCIRDLSVPSLALINGHAIGAGLCLAAACDFRIAVQSAKFGFTFTRLGLHPGMGGTFFLPKLVGVARATELMVTGKIIEAAEAERIGLVSKVVPADALGAQAESLVAEIMPSGPEAVAQLLATLRGDPQELQRALEREADCQKINYAGAEFAEGVRAAIEKRPPSFAKS